MEAYASGTIPTDAAPRRVDTRHLTRPSRPERASHARVPQRSEEIPYKGPIGVRLPARVPPPTLHNRPMPSPWQAFFDAHAPHYDENPFTAHTATEVDFLLRLFALPVGSAVLDMGCGTGRHALELAKRGYRVTGVDLSEGMLAVARAKAAVDGLDVRFVGSDATTFTTDERFDAAICLCEGGPGLIGKGDDAEAHDLAIFQSISRSLKPNAPFLLTALNGYATIRQMQDPIVHEGRFDPATMVSRYEDVWDLPEGERVVQIYERLFIPPEVVRLLKAAGFRVDAVWGGTAGHWAQRPLSLDEVEAMYVCRKA